MSYKYKQWDEILPSVLLAYRTTKHSVTKFSPFSLLYRRNTKLPIETIVETYYNDDNIENALIKRVFEIEDTLLKQQNEALNNIQQAQITQKDKYNNKVKVNKLHIGDKVLVAKSQLKNMFSAKLED